MYNAFDTDNKKGFCLMVEGAKIDHGGHSNKLKITIDEHLSFDRVVGIPNKVFELLN